MKTRDKILDLLESRKGEYISGEELASELSVTRAAVWKAVTGLREDGYPINAVPNKGYRLAEETDYLTEQGIWKYLDKSCNMLNIRQTVALGGILLHDIGCGVRFFDTFGTIILTRLLQFLAVVDEHTVDLLEEDGGFLTDVPVLCRDIQNQRRHQQQDCQKRGDDDKITDYSVF